MSMGPFSFRRLTEAVLNWPSCEVALMLKGEADQPIFHDLEDNIPRSTQCYTIARNHHYQYIEYKLSYPEN
jgi:hypothetical protein